MSKVRKRIIVIEYNPPSQTAVNIGDYIPNIGIVLDPSMDIMQELKEKGQREMLDTYNENIELINAYDNALSRLCDQAQGYFKCKDCILSKGHNEETCALDDLRKIVYKLGVDL